MVNESPGACTRCTDAAADEEDESSATRRPSVKETWQTFELQDMKLQLEKAHAEISYLQRHCKSMEEQLRRSQAESANLQSEVARLTTHKRQVTPDQMSQAQNSPMLQCGGRRPATPGAKTLSKQILSTQELEAREIEEKRQQVRLTMERNARHIARMYAQNAGQLQSHIRDLAGDSGMGAESWIMRSTTSISSLESPIQKLKPSPARRFRLT
eukprot:TRINITY_DN2624_c0_g1_i1.p1 TRINITY_DN2624_c0_g1~~TRINITY_DN2624_c0_g1_i1.p1  ORF type:complete len:241 (-),score=42.82 TRINITY_DN2624_c0_g1_i1:257-895(-)